MIRTHDAGTLTAADAGQTVTLAGWVARRRDHGGVAFLDLREASGIAQVVVRDESVAHSLRSEYCVAVTGTVQLRPEGNANPNLPSGEIEVIADTVEVLSASAALPFPIDDSGHGGGDVGEEARLKHRYLDLRRTGPNQALRLRSKVNKAARDVLDRRGFVEIETPTLTRSTPEGARDFLVPARLQPGSWYALPQSPQLFKQLLMVAGMERYFQIARCYRDEDFRADRQPEFTQLDIEMSFVDQDDVLAVSEEVLVALWQLIGVDLQTPFPRMTYAEAMARFGSDKPDLRMGLELVDCTDYFTDTPFRVFQSPYVGAVADARRCEPAPQAARRLAGVGQAARCAWSGLRPLHRGRRARRPGGQEPLGGGAGRPGRAPRRAAGRLRLLRGRPGEEQSRAARRCPARDRPSRRPHRRGRVEPALGRRRAALRACRRGHRGRRRRGRQRRLDGRAPRLHLAAGRRHLRPGPRQRAGVGLRHRLQRQRDRRRVHPYPPRGRAEARLRDHGSRARPRRPRSSGSSWTPSSTAPRRTAAWPSAGTGSWPCWRAPSRSAT